jgi:hypothetical protein
MSHLVGKFASALCTCNKRGTGKVVCAQRQGKASTFTMRPSLASSIAVPIWLGIFSNSASIVEVALYQFWFSKAISCDKHPIEHSGARDAYNVTAAV